jgi:hypothetical protein
MTEIPWNTPSGGPGTFEIPGLSVRATFLATDGSRPQELIIEWKADPGQAALAFVLDRIAALAAPGEAEVVVVPPQQPETDIPPGETTTQLPRPLCLKQGPGHDDNAARVSGQGHACTLFAGHDPVEPEGRQHRCRCGGIFATEDEVPDVAGRASRERTTEDLRNRRTR